MLVKIYEVRIAEGLDKPSDLELALLEQVVLLVDLFGQRVEV